MKIAWTVVPLRACGWEGKSYLHLHPPLPHPPLVIPGETYHPPLKSRIERVREIRGEYIKSQIEI